MEGADHSVEGRNPFCGDALTLWVKFDGDEIADVSFKGQGCAISKASASLMTSAVKGKTRATRKSYSSKFHELVTRRPAPRRAEVARISARIRRRVALSAASEVRESRVACDDSALECGARRRDDRRRRSGHQPLGEGA